MSRNPLCEHEVLTCLYMYIDLRSSPQDAIASARSLDEVQTLEAMLKAGQIPSDLGAPPPPPPHWPGQTNHQVVEEDEMETV